MFETLAHYKILDRIGTGGIGDVYRARDTRLGRTVAIKVVGPAVSADTERRERFSDSSDLAKRQADFEKELAAEGWSGPHGWVI